MGCDREGPLGIFLLLTLTLEIILKLPLLSSCLLPILVISQIVIESLPALVRKQNQTVGLLVIVARFGFA